MYRYLWTEQLLHHYRDFLLRRDATLSQQTIDMMAAGKINPKEVITSRIELEELVEKGFDALTNDKMQAKILVKLSGEQ